MDPREYSTKEITTSFQSKIRKTKKKSKMIHIIFRKRVHKKISQKNSHGDFVRNTLQTKFRNRIHKKIQQKDSQKIAQIEFITEFTK